MELCCRETVGGRAAVGLRPRRQNGREYHSELVEAGRLTGSLADCLLVFSFTLAELHYDYREALLLGYGTWQGYCGATGRATQ